MAQESTTLDAAIVVGPLGGALFHQSPGQAFSTTGHALHGSPIRKSANQPFHHQRFALHVDSDFRPTFQVRRSRTALGMAIYPLDEIVALIIGLLLPR